VAKKNKLCYVCKEAEGTLSHKLLFRNAQGPEEVSLPLCQECLNNYTLFHKVLKMFMVFTTAVFMILIAFVAYMYFRAGNTSTGLYVLLFMVLVNFLGFYIYKRLYHGSHFIQKAANEPSVTRILEKGYRGFLIEKQG
jgi:hypothetical protein